MAVALQARTAENPTHRVDLHGYVGTGLASAKRGNSGAIPSPEGPARYRLGEAHTNFEFAIGPRDLLGIQVRLRDKHRLFF
jgi:maltoporin